MAPPAADLQVDQDVTVERRQWRIERVARLVLLAIIVLALAGVLGAGPLSWTSASEGPLEASYERFARRGGTMTVDIGVAAGQARQDHFQVKVERDYLSEFRVEGIVPDPDSAVVTGRWVTYTFQTDDPDEGLAVSYALRPDGLWAVDGDVSLPDGTTVRISHFIYP